MAIVTTTRDPCLSLRIPPPIVAAVDEYVLARRRAEPGATFSRADALRVLIGKGLEAERARGVVKCG